MAVVSRIKQDGTYLSTNKVDTRTSTVQDGLMFYMPFDQNTLKGYHDIANAKVLGYYSNASHPTYDYIAARCSSITLSADILAETTSTVVDTYDLVVVDQYVWAVSSGIMTKLKEFVDAGISVIAVGNDTRTNVFVSAYTAVARVTHTAAIDPYGRLDIAGSFTGSADVFGGIDSLQNGAIPEYYRSDTGQIMGYTYTSESGAILYFDQEGFGNTAAVLAGLKECLLHTKGRQSSASTLPTFEGLGISESTDNLYADGNYAEKTLHPVRNGPWTFPDDIKGPSGQQVIRVDADGTTSYHGRDITVTTGVRYTASCWCYVSSDANTTSTRLAGEQGYPINPSTSYYDLSKKGTWQFLYSSGDATGTNARILAYQVSNMTRGFVLFTDVQFQAEKYPTPFVPVSFPFSSFEQNFAPLSECTIVGKFKPLSGFDNSPSAAPDYTNTSNNQSSLIGVHDTVNGSNAYYKFYQSANGASSPFLDPDGAWGTQHRHVAYELTTDPLYYMITLTSNTTLSINIYQNGTWNGAHVHTFAATASIDTITFGQNAFAPTTIWNGYHSNMAVYNRVLTQAEVEKIINTSHIVTAESTVAKNLQTKPYLPNDISFLSLGENGGNNTENTIVPVVDTANYVEGDAYVGGNKLQYNLNSTLGLDWNADWSICYMKKPIGTHSGELVLTGYSIESLGSNSNSVGGGYVWWGKNNGSNTLSATTNSTIDPNTYFNNWQYVTLVKSGTTVTIETWIKDSIQRTRTYSLSSVASNYYVNQYGYDLYLGGWDNNNGCYTRFKNLVVAQRALSSNELNNFRLNKIKALKDVVYFQAGIETDAVL